MLARGNFSRKPAEGGEMDSDNSLMLPTRPRRGFRALQKMARGSFEIPPFELMDTHPFLVKKEDQSSPFKQATGIDRFSVPNFATEATRAEARCLTVNLNMQAIVRAAGGEKHIREKLVLSPQQIRWIVGENKLPVLPSGLWWHFFVTGNNDEILVVSICDKKDGYHLHLLETKKRLEPHQPQVYGVGNYFIVRTPN